ncbi:MAG: hypothetical protein J5761_01830 [Paludibacteraceae bacterium]|nr:hypothetical protein [Paludibacteraceae bacterium]
MRKIFLFLAAMFTAITMNAATHNINPSAANSLHAALNAAAAGDTIVLANGTYVENKNGANSYITFSKNVVVMAAKDAAPVIDMYVAMCINSGALVEIKGLKFDATHVMESAISWANHIFYAEGTGNNRVIFDGCEFYNDTLDAASISCASSDKIDSLVIKNCYFHDITKSVLSLGNAGAKVRILNSTFSNINGATGAWYAPLHVTGTDASVVVDYCTFYNIIGRGDYAPVTVENTTNAVVSNSIFVRPEVDNWWATRMPEGTTVKNCVLYKSTNWAPFGYNGNPTPTNCVQEESAPFENAAAGNYTLVAGAKALKASEKAGPVGDPRWAPAPQTLYVKISEDWKYPSKYALYYFDETKNGWSDFMTEVEGEEDIYTADIPANYSTVIVARFNSTKAATGNWDDKWSQTVDLTLEEGKDLFTITSGGTGNECNGTWSKFVPTPEPGCDWANIAWVGASNNKLKVCKDGEVPNVINVQHPDFAAEDGIYMTFPSDVWDKSKFSLPASKYAIQGAGMVIYLSALDLQYNEININAGNTDYAFTVYNADGAEEVYAVAGSSATLFGTTWDTYANKMTLNEGIYKLEKTEVELAAGDINFKVVKNHTYDTSWPVSNYSLNIPADGIYTITITFNPDSKAITATATKTGEAVVVPEIKMHGNFAGGVDWADTEAFEVAEGKLTASLALNLAKGNYTFGMKKDGTWTANGVAFTRANPSAAVIAGEGNLTLNADVAGEYTFTWTYETNTLAITYPVKYYEFATGHEKKADFGDASARILLTLSKSGNDVVVTIKNNTAAGNPQTGLNYLWVNATDATNNNATYGSHETENTETVSVTVKFDAAKETYNFVNIHWAYAGFPGEWAIDGLTVPATALCDLVDGYYLVGQFGGVEAWNAADLTPAKRFAANPGNAAEYLLAGVTLTAGDALKVVKVKNDGYETWYSANNYVVDAAHAGEKTIYFRPDGQGQGEGWHEGLIYIEANATTAIGQTTNDQLQTTKVLRDGQLLILRDGKTYNVLGATVK